MKARPLSVLVLLTNALRDVPKVKQFTEHIIVRITIGNFYKEQTMH